MSYPKYAFKLMMRWTWIIEVHVFGSILFHELHGLTEFYLLYNISKYFNTNSTSCLHLSKDTFTFSKNGNVFWISFAILGIFWMTTMVNHPEDILISADTENKKVLAQYVSSWLSKISSTHIYTFLTECFLNEAFAFWRTTPT